MNALAPNQRCVDSYGTRRSEGDIWYRDECTQCACQKSVVVCKSKECMQPPPGCNLLDPFEDDCCGTVVCPHTTGKLQRNLNLNLQFVLKRLGGRKEVVDHHFQGMFVVICCPTCYQEQRKINKYYHPEFIFPFLFGQVMS